MNVKTILSKFSKVKTVPQRRRKAQELAKSLGVGELKDLIEKLNEEGGRASMNLIAHLITPELCEKYPAFVLRLVGKLARDEDWEVREEAATVLKRLKEKHFETLYPHLESWAKGESTFLKRAVCVALIKSFKREKENLEKIFALLEEIIPCDDNYVKENCGPFGLAAIFRRYPKETEKKLYQWLRKYSNNPTVIWNIITIFSQANAKYFKKEGKRVLDKIEKLGLIAKYPKLKRIFEGVKKKLL